jgi:hypothetical protein
MKPQGCRFELLGRAMSTVKGITAGEPTLMASLSQHYTKVIPISPNVFQKQQYARLSFGASHVARMISHHESPPFILLLPALMLLLTLRCVYHTEVLAHLILSSPLLFHF